MKFLTSFFSRLYQYATACIVVGTPLFFVPGTSFTSDTTYLITMMVLVTVALVSYIFTATVTKSWHSVSKLEFVSYFAFSIAVLLSALFAKNPRFVLFGDIFNHFAAVPLLSLPVVMYLVRSLPESLRHKLKYIILGVLSVSAFVFVSTLIFSGKFITYAKPLFAGFSNSASLAVYLGIFSVSALFFAKKLTFPKKYKVAVVITALLFAAWALALSAQDGVRPNLTSTLLVGKKVLMNDGVFGIGAGNFSRAWQLYKPANVTASQFFGYDFNYGADTMTTLFVTIGILGLLAFIMLTLSALYSTVISYLQNPIGKDHVILGLLSLILLYLVLVSWTMPFSYAILVAWMILSGLGLAKARLSEFHPSKKLAFLMVPLALLFVANMVVTFQKVSAFSLFSKAQASTTTKEAYPLLEKAIQTYPYDGFYRMKVELAIQDNRDLVASNQPDQEALKKSYLEKATMAVDAGLAATKANPDNYQNYVSLGRAYELALPFDKEGGFNNAKKSYQEAAKLYPENPYLYLMLARLESSAGTKEGVRVQLTEALKKKQNFADALYLMSQLEASESKIDEALAYAIEAVKNAPNDPLVYTQAGLLFYGKKDYQNAVLALKTALEKDQNNANIAYFLALTLRDGGRADLAKPIADELLKRNPGNADLEAFLKSLTPITQETPVVAPKKASKK